MGLLHYGRGGGHSPALGALLLLLGAFAPSFVALSLTATAEGRSGAGKLLGRVLPGRVAARWYLFALAYTPAIELGGALVHGIATGAWPRFGNQPW